MNTTSQIVEVDRISGQETVRVVIKDKIIHSKYHKRFSRTNHLLVNSKGFEVKTGDIVEIIESKPVSKKKAWTIKTIKEKKQ